jgi:hypothetical protein
MAQPSNLSQVQSGWQVHAMAEAPKTEKAAQRPPFPDIIFAS